MKMKKVIRILFFILIYLMSFAGAYSIVNKDVTTTVIGKISTEPSVVIEGVTPSVKLTVRVRVKANSRNAKVSLKDWKFKNDISYFILEDVRNESGGGRFFIDFDNSNEAEFTASGNLIIDWKKMKTNPILKLAEVHSGKGKDENYIGDILISLRENLNFVSSLKVHVLQDMDFKTIIAGQTADTKENMRNPAVIEVEGEKNKNVIITLPEPQKEISNKNGDSLIVNFRFRESGNQEILKNINQMNGKELTGKTEPVIIDGNVKTKPSSSGTYTGTFTVRAEYEY